MDTITGGNIQIDSNLRIKYITTLKIVTEMQKHGTCRLTGVLEDGLEAQQLLSSRDDIPISITGNGDCKEVLFRGIIKKAEIDVVNGIYHVYILAVSLSEMLDRTKKQRSFQDVTMTYEQAVDRVLETYGNLTAFYSKNAQETLNEPVIQYGETDWEFLLRLGSHLHIPVYADGVSRSKVLCFGVEEGVPVNIESGDYHAGISEKYYEADERRDSVTRRDYLYYRITCDGNYRIGDEINIGTCSYVIFRKSAELVHEQLEFTYWAGGCGNLYIPYIGHDRLVGIEFTGTVVGTQAEKAKIRLKIDEPYEGADYDWDWVPASGNIMYAMPEQETSVRLCFGSETASEGIITSNTRDSSGSMLEWQNRTFMTGAGKKAQFYPERLAFQGGNGKVTLSDGKTIAFTGMDKLEIIASGTIQLAAANIYGQVPLEINMYRARAYCEAKGKGITAKGTKSNPPTATGDVGFTINNEFNASSQTCVMYGKQFIQYRPFEDDPEETDELFDGWAFAGHILAGVGVVAAVAVGTGYAASLVFTSGATAVFAPYVVGGMAALCGGTAVYGLANNDYQNQEVSSLGTYVGTAGYASMDGARAGASFCMVPYAAEVGVAMYAPYGMPIAGTFVTSETLLTSAMASGYVVTASNMAVKINDYSAGVIGRNMMEDAFGQENYQMVKSASQFGSDTIFMMGLSNPNLYSRNNDTGNIRQNAMYDNSEGGSDTVTYRRVQGGSGNNASQVRIEVNADGTISIPNKDANLSISIDNGEHAEYFLNKRGGDAQIVEVDVPKWFDDFLQENAIPQVNYTTNPLNQGGTAPKITDITTPGNCFELPAPWIEWLEEYGSNARIVTP